MDVKACATPRDVKPHLITAALDDRSSCCNIFTHLDQALKATVQKEDQLDRVDQDMCSGAREEGIPIGEDGGGEDEGPRARILMTRSRGVGATPPQVQRQQPPPAPPLPPSLLLPPPPQSSSSSPPRRASSRRGANIRIELNTTSDHTLHALFHTPLSKLSVSSANIVYSYPSSNQKLISVQSVSSPAKELPRRQPQCPAEEKPQPRICGRRSKTQSEQLLQLSVPCSRRADIFAESAGIPPQCKCGAADLSLPPRKEPRYDPSLRETLIQPRAVWPAPSQEPVTRTWNMDDFQPGQPLEEVTINLGDDKALDEFYEERFKCLQQIPCKSIAKDWIKVIEPRKQTLHPYNGGEQAKGRDKNSNVDVGELCKPEWWPREGCRHREPDHISRQERMVLLKHLLRNLWDSNAKSGYRSINVDKLAASTAETVASWSSQEIYRENRVILEGIYNMRRAEERLKNGETDASEEISCPKIPRSHRASRRTKQLAGSKRRAENELPDGGNDENPAPTGNSHLESLSPPSRQGHSFNNTDASFSYAGGPSGAPSYSNWAQDTTMGHVAGLSHGAEDHSWHAAPEPLTDPSLAARMARQFAAEQSMSPSDRSDDRLTSPRVSTHPSSVTSEFTPGSRGPMSKRPADIADLEFDWTAAPTVTDAGPRAHMVPYETVHPGSSVHPAATHGYTTQQWVWPRSDGPSPGLMQMWTPQQAGYGLVNPPPASEASQMFGSMPMATSPGGSRWHL